MDFKETIFEFGELKQKLNIDIFKLKLGKVFFLIRKGLNEFELSENQRKNSLRVAVTFINFHHNTVTLIDKYNLDKNEVLRVQEILKGYLEVEEIEIKLYDYASKLKVENLYMSSEYDDSILCKIMSVCQRLELISTLKDIEISKRIMNHWEPIVSYHLLTCFDLLGQPNHWMNFESWLISSKTKDEREEIIQNMPKEFNFIEAAKHLNSSYNLIYGVKNSFFNFIRNILPKETRLELLNSIVIKKTPFPFSLNSKTEYASIEERERFLFDIRNNYTHKTKTINGINPQLLKMENILKNSPTVRFDEFKKDTWLRFLTVDWPFVLEKTLKIGLCEYIKKN